MIRKVDRIQSNRIELRDRMFSGTRGYEGPEKGWFKAPRSLPFLMSLLALKKVSGKMNPALVYLELLSRHRDSGFIDLPSESDSAFACGYTSNRGLRTWRERMALLESLRLIKSKPLGGQKYKYVLLLSPDDAIQILKAANKLPNGWKNAYDARRLESKEVRHLDEGDEQVLDVPVESNHRRKKEKK